MATRRDETRRPGEHQSEYGRGVRRRPDTPEDYNHPLIVAASIGAAFQLAETYDPRQLSRWHAFGVRGDWDRAQALYLTAQRGGIKEANERIGPPQ